MYHAGWAWAGDTPFQYTKLIASHFGGTRNPMAISWPARIKPDKTPRSQFHHVNDIAPTIYEILGIKPPKVVDGFKQDPIDGVSMVYTFADAKAPGAQAHPVLRQQRQPRHLSRRLVCLHLRPADAVAHGESPGLATWDSDKDVWELYDLKTDFSQADDLAAKEPQAAGRDEGAVPEGGEGEQGLPDRRRHLAAHPSRGPRQDALHELAFRRDDDPHARVHRAGPRPREQPRHHRCRARRERLRRALRAGRRQRRAHALHGRRATSSTSTT